MTPARTIAPQPWMTTPSARAVMTALGSEGEARFVGGCVRDVVLGGGPHGDIDIAATLTPERVLGVLKAAGIKAIPTGIDHGTVTAVAADAHYEITTLRRDVRTYGRHADVAFTDDWEEDAARRDFTFNAMSLTEAGEIFDYFGGLDDLAAGRVRFVGDPETRIREDVLRVLRFFRFHARYGKGAPDAGALAAVAKLADLVPGLSAERVWAELSRILVCPDPAAALKLMADAGVLAQVVAEALQFDRLAALVVIEGAEGLTDTSTPIRRLAAVLDGDAAAAGTIAGRLRLSRNERGRLERLMTDGTTIPPEQTKAEARHALYREGADLWRDRLLLSWAAEKAEGAGRDADAAYAGLLELATGFVPPRFPLSGEDAKALGLAPSPAMGAALRAVEDWWVDADFRPGREDCLARLRTVIEG